MPCTYAAIFCTRSTFQVSKESCLCKGVFFQYQFEIIVGTIFFFILYVIRFFSVKKFISECASFMSRTDVDKLSCLLSESFADKHHLRNDILTKSVKIPGNKLQIAQVLFQRLLMAMWQWPFRFKKRPDPHKTVVRDLIYKFYKITRFHNMLIA